MYENVSNCPVIIVPADGLAPLGARPSAGTVMTNAGSCMYIVMSLGWLTHWDLDHMSIYELDHHLFKE